MSACYLAYVTVYLTDLHINFVIQINDTNANAEMQRYARVSLGKLLFALGDELTDRINMLRAQLQGHAQPGEIWIQLAQRHMGAAAPELQEPTAPFIPPVPDQQ